jgi:hypothetical protein
MTQNGPAAESTLMATCPCCGDVVVTVGATRVGRGEGARPGWYAFDCPQCRRSMRVDAAEHLVSVLMCLGATEVAPPLTLDEVIQATLTLHSTDDLVALATGR